MDENRPERELGPEYVASLDELRQPGPELEERIVAELRRRSLLRGDVEPATTGATRQGWSRVRPWLVGAAAATVAFALGVRAGEQRSTEPAVRVEAAPTDSAQVAARVRAAAVDYLIALSAVTTTDADARGAAIATFRTAADHIIRLAPESDLAIAIGLAYPTSFVAAPTTEAALTPAPRIIWF